MRIELRPLEEQVAVVIGASSGIGRETALELAGRGAKLVVVARDREGLDDVVAEIEKNGGRALPVIGDVAVFDDMAAVAARAVEEYGGLDSWIHSAAVMEYARFEDTTPEEFRRVIEVNLLGQVHGAMAALPRLRASGQGAFIGISSIEAIRAVPLQSAYAASKHGVKGFLDALRMELEQDGVPIAVTNVMPASVNTPLFRRARVKMAVMPQPPPPIYEPATVAKVIVHACEHPSRELYAGGGGRAAIALQRLSPRLVDSVLSRFGIRAQLTDEPDTGTDNLFSPVPGGSSSSGSYTGTFHRSAYNWIQLHSPLRWVGQVLTGPRRRRDRPEPR